MARDIQEIKAVRARMMRDFRLRSWLEAPGLFLAVVGLSIQLFAG